MLELLLDLTRRALEGFVFAAPCVGIWFLGLRFHKKAPPFAHCLPRLDSACICPAFWRRQASENRSFFSRISLMPFVGMELPAMSM